MKTKGKRIYDYTTLVVGKRYIVFCGVWQGALIYCGTVNRFARIEYLFTYGKTVEDWHKSFNICACKSKIKVFEIANEQKLNPRQSDEV